MASEHVFEADDSSFEQEVINSDLPTLVDFWGPSCGPCIAMLPMIEKLAADHLGRLKVVKVNVEQSPSTAMKFAVRSLPTLMLVKQGKVIDSFNGRPAPAALEKFIQRAFA